MTYGDCADARRAAAPSLPAGKLPNTDQVVVQRGSNQLISFGLFKSKDPFVQQLAGAATPATAAPDTDRRHPAHPSSTREAAGAGLTPATSVTPAPSTPANPSSSDQAPPTAPASPTTTPAQTTPTAPEAAPTTALISTNGACEKVP